MFAIGRHDPVANKAITHPARDRDLAKALGEGKGSCECCGVRQTGADNLKQFHHMRRGEEMKADHPFGMGAGSRNRIDVEIGGVGRQHRIGFAMGGQFGKHVVLDAHVLEHGLDHQIAIGKRCVVRAADEIAQKLIMTGLGDDAAFERPAKMMADIGDAAFTGVFVTFDHHHGIAGQKGGSGDTGPHDAAANDADFGNGAGIDPGQFGQLGNGSFGKENMAQRL